jgi:hypothetical protein
MPDHQEELGVWGVTRAVCMCGGFSQVQCWMLAPH